MGAFISLAIAEVALVASSFLSILSASKSSGDARKYSIINAVTTSIAAVIAFIIAILLF